MGTLFGDAAGDEDGDLVGVAGGGDAVGDEDGGATAHDVAQAGEDALFGVGVYAGEGVVEDQDSRRANERPRDGGTLLLAAGEGDAPLADQGLEAEGELEDFGGDVGDAGGAFDLGFGGVGCAEGDVVGDGVGEEEGFLWDEADVFAEVGEGVVADGAVVEEERVGGGVVEAGDEGYEGGFAGAGGAYDGEGGAGGDIEGDVVEDFGAAGGVGEREVAEVDVAVDLGW